MDALFADAQVYGYVGPNETVSPKNASADEPVTAVRGKDRYHSGMANLELEQGSAVRLSSTRLTGLVPCGDEGQSFFNPIVISKVGGAGLM